MDKYLKKAKKLKSSGFWVAGFGHFDISDDELAQILKWVEKDDFVSIKNLYIELEKIRL